MRLLLLLFSSVKASNGEDLSSLLLGADVSKAVFGVFIKTPKPRID